ncbi:MAG TPA: DNA oxidative demethylase AlkB [Arenibaculum sp.]|nr:DNA oxidative demethylase AlkB [Arenibaculum sp.]
MRDLFHGDAPPLPPSPPPGLAEGVVLLRGHADTAALAAPLRAVLDQAPLRRMSTPGGRTMSVAMSNCGPLGWVTDRRGYRYEPADPATGRPWPPMPGAFAELAAEAARTAGFPGFRPDACLINRYEPGARLALHQDRDERDFGQPIVSVSLGLPAVFLLGGARRSDPVARLRLEDGDVLVFGGPARLVHHGVKPVEAGEHPLLGACRINLTFRKAG